MKPDDPSLVSPETGKITLQNSAERLDQLRVKEESEPKSSKPTAEASEANREIASENDPRSS
jgi:hypothetical protein